MAYVVKIIAMACFLKFLSWLCEPRKKKKKKKKRNEP